MAKRTQASGNAHVEVEPKLAQRRFDRSELIFTAAANIFRSKGYDATSLQEIADEVGILKGSMYHYIDTKEDLLFEIIRRNHQLIISNNQQWRTFDDPLVALRSFIEGHIRESLRNQTDSIIFMRDFRALSPDRANEILRTEENYDKDFRGLVRKALDAGRLRPGVTPAFAARAVFGMLNWIVSWYESPGKVSADKVVAELSTYAMASLLAIDPSID